MQYLRNFSQLQHAAQQITNNYSCIVLNNKISSQTTFVRHNSEFDSWVSTALDIITCKPSSEQDKPEKEPISVKFIPDQIAPSERRLSKLIAEHTKRKKLFYGIELAAHYFSIPLALDYNQFGNHLPLFTALIWIGKEYGPVARLIDVEMIQLALQLQPHTIVLPHFACNCADQERLLELLALNFLNIFVIRGNQPKMQNQVFPETADLVREIRRIKGGNISIGVGGYPEGHMEARTLEENMKILKKKLLREIIYRKHIDQSVKFSRRHNMHYPGNIPVRSLSTNSSIPAVSLVNLQFAPNQQQPEQYKLSDLIRDHTQRKEFFYGIEMIAHNFRSTPLTLDYSGFGAMLPLFTSLVWLGSNYWNVTPIVETETMCLLRQLKPHTIALPHFSCYRATRSRVADLMAMNISNVLVVRGDVIEPEQEFKHASDLVAEIRKLRGDTISIGVAGHPDGHPDSKSFEDDLEFLVKKIDAGADFIITQVCFSSKSLIDFIKACRAKGITVPIILGIFVPHNMQILRRTEEITRVHMLPDQMNEYASRAADVGLFQEYAQKEGVKMIKDVFDSGLDIYGVQFYTMNNFKNPQQTLHKLLQEIRVENNSENIL